MDRNTITGLILIFAIFIGFSLYNNQRVGKSFEKIVVVADSLYDAGDYEEALAEYRKALQYKPGEPAATGRVREITARLQPLAVPDTTSGLEDDVVDTPSQVVAQPVRSIRSSESLGYFAGAGNDETRFIKLKNSLVDLDISNRGARIYNAELLDYKTHDGKPLILIEGDSTLFGFKFFTTDNKPIETNDLFFTYQGKSDVVDATNSQGKVVMRLMAGDDAYIEYTYTLEPESYMVGFDVRFVNMEDKIAANLNSMTFDWQAYMKQQEKGRQNENMYSNVRYKHLNAEVDGFRARTQKDSDRADISTKLEWIAFKDQFFSTVLINPEGFSNGSVGYQKMPDDVKYHRFCTADLGLPFNSSGETGYNLKIYIGPNNYKMLKDYGYDLQELVNMGKGIIRWINQYVIVTIFNWLNKSIANYGIIILILTLIIKAVLFPLTFKSYQSQAKMKVLKPMVDEIGKKFPKQEDAMKKQQATMDLYKKAGVSTLDGCLPMALQMPILFAMFRFFPASIELRQEGFLWATDLSTYDSILDLPFTIPMYGDHISLFTLLMTISTIITMKINSPASTGQEQVPGMKMMMYMMPVMFMLILNNFSSGLTYYYFLANIITFGQNMLSKRFIDEEAVLKKLEANRKKPVSKSKFQKRLEEAAKQRGYKPSKKK